jgi:hypothetical protein
VVAWYQRVVLVGFAEAVFPVLELALGQTDPDDEATGRQAGLVAPGADEVDDGVACIVGDPAAL